MGEFRLTISTRLRQRREIREAIEEYCFRNGFGCEFWEKRYWFHYLVRVVITAPDRYIPHVQKDIDSLLS